MRNVTSLPLNPSFENYILAWENTNLMIYFANSLFITSVSIVFIIIFAIMVAFVMARYRFRMRKVMYFFFLIGMLIPTQTTLVPLFVMFRNFGLINKLPTLLLPYVGVGVPLAIFILESFIRTSVPKELDEAAWIDGAGSFRILTMIIMPMTRPAIATVTIMSYLFVWNDLSFPLVFINNDLKKTLQAGLRNYMGEFTTLYTQLMAAMVLSIVPIMLVYFIFQRDLVKGLLAGSLKE
jgi:raffinose/stachyose/melibiose transport system permease protein